MANFFKSTLLFIFLFSFTNSSFAQKKTKTKMTSFDFEYNGEVFKIQKGTKIHLGFGSADDGSFNYIKYWEGHNTRTSKRREVNMENDKANKNAEVSSFSYWKMNDSWTIYIKIYKGAYYHIQLYEAIEKGEIIGIDEFYFNKNNSSSSETNTKTELSSGLTHILKLNNGSEIKCKILEYKPNETIKIETFDGSIFVYKTSEIEELVSDENLSNTSTPNNSESKKYRNYEMSGNYEEVEKKGSKFIKDTTIKRFFNGLDASAFYQLPDLYTYRLKSSWLGFGLKYTAGYQLNNYILLGANAGLNVHLGEKFEKEIRNTDGFIIGFFGLAQKISLLGKKKVSPEISFDENFGSLISHDGRYIFDFETSIGVRIKTKKPLTYRVSVGYVFQNTKSRGISTKAQHVKLNFGVNF